MCAVSDAGKYPPFLYTYMTVFFTIENKILTHTAHWLTGTPETYTPIGGASASVCITIPFPIHVPSIQNSRRKIRCISVTLDIDGN